jgi:ribonuclease P protein component
MRGQRFTRQQRLLRPGDFSRVMAEAQRSSDSLFTVLARENALQRARLGLAISRKAARRAVDRNRIKRIARESFRHCGHNAAVDVIVFARRPAATQARAELRRSLDRHFRRLLGKRAG